MHFRVRSASGHFQLSRNFCPSAWKKPLVRGSIPLLLGQFPAKGAQRNEFVHGGPTAALIKNYHPATTKGPLARFTLLLFLALPFIRPPPSFANQGFHPLLPPSSCTASSPSRRNFFFSLFISPRDSSSKAKRFPLVATASLTERRRKLGGRIKS